ncbi:MAG: isoprenylcysteine carboxylmethyltransferase family protein [Anaerolineae bacterium]
MTQSKQLLKPRVILQVLVFVVALPMLPLIVSGQWSWVEGWVFAWTYILSFAISRLLVARRNPDLIGERARFLRHKDIEPFDRVLAPLLAILSVLMLGVIGLDKRFTASPPFPLAVVLVAYGLIVVGWVFGSWALLANPYFSGEVRLQRDRGQHVISSGPYHWIRHPGYVGGLLTYLATPFFLGSLWGILPALLLSTVLIVRTQLEDRTLQAELDGYRAYAGRVRWRLLPGVW